MLQIRVGSFAAEKIADKYGPERTTSGQPSEWDFLPILVEAARLGFRDFESLPSGGHPRIRTLHVLVPFVGAVAITGVLVDEGVVEIADFEVDPDYWEIAMDDPID